MKVNIKIHCCRCTVYDEYQNITYIKHNIIRRMKSADLHLSHSPPSLNPRGRGRDNKGIIPEDHFHGKLPNHSNIKIER